MNRNMIIDAHNHPDWYGYDYEAYLKNMEENHIDKTWLLSWECPDDEYDSMYKKVVPNPKGDNPIPFKNCLNYYYKNPEKFILGYAPDPRRPESLKLLKEAVSAHQVKVCGEIKVRMLLDNPDAIAMFRYCGEEGLPVVVHLDYEYPSNPESIRPNWWYSGGIEVLERVLIKCPDTKFLGHAPGFWAHMSKDDQYLDTPYPKGKVIRGGAIETLLRKYDNLYCDISAGSGLYALKRDEDYTKEFLEEFQDRVLYARDDFHNEHQIFLNSLPLKQGTYEKIYYKNALSLIK